MNDMQIIAGLRRTARHMPSVDYHENVLLKTAADRLEELTRPARLLTREETMALAKQGRPCYAECEDGECAWLVLSGTDDDEPYLIGYDGDGNGWSGSQMYLMAENVDTGTARPAPGAWRPWDKEPDAEQRKEAPWA